MKVTQIRFFDLSSHVNKQVSYNNTRIVKANDELLLSEINVSTGKQLMVKAQKSSQDILPINSKLPELK